MLGKTPRIRLPCGMTTSLLVQTKREEQSRAHCPTVYKICPQPGLIVHTSFLIFDKDNRARIAVTPASPCRLANYMTILNIWPVNGESSTLSIAYKEESNMAGLDGQVIC